jgi:hypothetical protein
MYSHKNSASCTHLYSPYSPDTNGIPKVFAIKMYGLANPYMVTSTSVDQSYFDTAQQRSLADISNILPGNKNFSTPAYNPAYNPVITPDQ